MSFSVQQSCEVLCVYEHMLSNAKPVANGECCGWKNNAREQHATERAGRALREKDTCSTGEVTGRNWTIISYVAG